MTGTMEEPVNPDEKFLEQEQQAIKEKDEKTARNQLKFLGTIGMLLPLVVPLWAIFFHTGTFQIFVLGSISAYYYTAAVSFFGGMLFVLAFFFFTYTGFDNADHKYDWYSSRIAGLAAILVALFPTSVPNGYQRLLWWYPYMQWIHFSFAALLLLSFACISFFLFPQSAGKKKGKFFEFSLLRFPSSEVQEKDHLSDDKLRRNRIYWACGWVILLSVAWAAICVPLGRPIFLPEAIALEAFAFSFLTKGHIVEFAKTARDTLKSPHALKMKIKQEIYGKQAAEMGDPIKPSGSTEALMS